MSPVSEAGLITGVIVRGLFFSTVGVGLLVLLFVDFFQYGRGWFITGAWGSRSVSGRGTFTNVR